MGIARLNIWVSDVADACGTWPNSGRATVFDCKGILQWPCGRFRTEGTDWQPVPKGAYINLPFRCGHLEVELPPGCYWVVAGTVTPQQTHIHLNYTTHVGIAQVRCDESACVKLYNPSIRLCWNWALVGFRTQAARGVLDPELVKEIERRVEDDLLREIPANPVEELMRRTLDELTEGGKERS